MKRTIFAIWLAIIVGSITVPVQFSFDSRGAQLDLMAASAATTTDGGGGSGPAPVAACPDGEVQLSVKVNATDSGCVKPDPNGGVIITYLKMILKFMSGGVGIVILLMLTIAGIQYMTAAGQPEQVKLAKSRIQNAITGLVLFLIAFAVLNLIIPGSIFG